MLDHIFFPAGIVGATLAGHRHSNLWHLAGVPQSARQMLFANSEFARLDGVVIALDWTPVAMARDGDKTGNITRLWRRELISCAETGRFGCIFRWLGHHGDVLIVTTQGAEIPATKSHAIVDSWRIDCSGTQQ